MSEKVNIVTNYTCPHSDTKLKTAQYLHAPEDRLSRMEIESSAMNSLSEDDLLELKQGLEIGIQGLVVQLVEYDGTISSNNFLELVKPICLSGFANIVNKSGIDQEYFKDYVENSKNLGDIGLRVLILSSLYAISRELSVNEESELNTVFNCFVTYYDPNELTDNHRYKALDRASRIDDTEVFQKYFGTGHEDEPQIVQFCGFRESAQLYFQILFDVLNSFSLEKLIKIEEDQAFTNKMSSYLGNRFKPVLELYEYLDSSERTT